LQESIQASLRPGEKQTPRGEEEIQGERSQEAFSEESDGRHHRELLQRQDQHA